MTENDKKYFISQMDQGLPVKIDIESHLVGSPTKGYCLNPQYLKKIIDKIRLQFSRLHLQEKVCYLV